MKVHDAASKPTHTVEDYLMRMLVMERDDGEIVAARLAEQLQVAPPTVAMTLKRMERDGYVTGRGRKTLHLTEMGRQFGQAVTRRHMLLEWLLIKVFKVPLPEIHEEAHGLEHAISASLEERMVDILGDPKVCPHGNPMPGCEDYLAKWVPLSDCEEGQDLIIHRIHESAEDDHDLLHYLIEQQILPGSRVKLTKKLPFNQTCTIEMNGVTSTLGFVTAKMVFVEKV